MAVEQAREYVEAGFTHVVDIDLSKFFDRVHHDRLMSRLGGVFPPRPARNAGERARPLDQETPAGVPLDPVEPIGGRRAAA